MPRRGGCLKRREQEEALLQPDSEDPAASTTMRAAVYVGGGRIEVQEAAVPVPGDGEITLRVKACGLCMTDVKKVTANTHNAPRVFGHEIAGVISSVGRNVHDWRPGDRVVAHHHIPCGSCFWCKRGLFATCLQFRQNGTTAGIGAPAGGGFSEMILVRPWCLPGLVRIPDSVDYARATFLEPVNTCLKALATANLSAGDTLLVVGQGPIGLLFTWLATAKGIQVVAVDSCTDRLTLPGEFGACGAFEPCDEELRGRLSQLTDGRGADAAIITGDNDSAVGLGVELTRAGGKTILFAHTDTTDRQKLGHTDSTGLQKVDLGRVCKEEQSIIGSYSADFNLQGAAAAAVFSNAFPADRLITHTMPLERLAEAIQMASSHADGALKIVITP